MARLGKFMDQAIQLIFGTLVAISCVFAFSSPNFKMVHFFGHYWAKIIGICVTLILLWLLWRPKVRHWLKNFAFSWRWAALGVVVLFAYQMVMYWQLTLIPNWDPGTIMNNVPENTSYFYFSVNYNNTLLLLLEKGLWHMLVPGLFSQFTSALLVVNAIVLDSALLAVYTIGRRLKDQHLASLLFCLGLLFWGLSPWILVFYSDTLGIFAIAFLMLVAILLWQAQRTWQRLVWAGVYGLLALISFWLKPTSLIFSIAFLLVVLVKALRQSSTWRQKLVGLVCILGIAGILGGGSKLYTNYIYSTMTFQMWGQQKKLNPALRMPPTHFIAMGLTLIGGFNPEDTKASYEAPTYQARDEMNRQKIKTRLKNYGVWRYLNFLILKFNNNIGNGNFTWDGDVTFRAKNNPRPLNLISRFSRALNYGKAKLRDPMRFVNQITWILLLLMSWVSVLANPKTGRWLLRTCQLTVVGVLIYLLIFEGGTSRYVFMWLPCFVVCGAYGLDQYWRLPFDQLFKRKV
ncbi:integral membrane protein [Agrilactobacillus composti DSM 18527 = JCM 14202]|nr:hypothetical protein [Agrilactobacillus composti]GAF38635.1 integral membrane protein [Agrilactobacillus composti DSM 18527 = JCM 14202]